MDDLRVKEQVSLWILIAMSAMEENKLGTAKIGKTVVVQFDSSEQLLEV